MNRQRRAILFGKVIFCIGVGICVYGLWLIPEDPKLERASPILNAGFAALGFGAVFRFVPLRRAIFVAPIAAFAFYVVASFFTIFSALFLCTVPRSTGYLAIAAFAALTTMPVMLPIGLREDRRFPSIKDSSQF